MQIAPLIRQKLKLPQTMVLHFMSTGKKLEMESNGGIFLFMMLHLYLLRETI